MRQLLNLRLCSSFSLPSASPFLSFPLPLSALSLYAFSPSLFLSFSHQPQFPPSFILPLKLISCFLILSSPSELRITLGSLPSHSPPPVHCPSLHPLSRQLFPSLLLLLSCFSFLSPFSAPSPTSLSPLHLQETLRVPKQTKPGQGHPSSLTSPGRGDWGPETKVRAARKSEWIRESLSHSPDNPTSSWNPLSTLGFLYHVTCFL